MASDALGKLRLNARDLGTTTLSRLPREMKRVCFLVVNTSRACRLGIGTTPIQRAIRVAQLFKSFGYDVVYMANPHCVMFREYFSIFLQRSREHVIFCCIGQGGEPGPESLIFDDEPMPDADFLEIVNNERCPGLKVTLISDFYTEGSLFQTGEGFIEDTITITCAGDEDKVVEGPDLLIDSIVKEIKNRNELTNQQLLDSLRIVIKRHGMTLCVKANPTDLMREPVAIYSPTVERNDLIR